MQLLPVLLLAAPALAVTTLVQKVQQLTTATSDVNAIVKNITPGNIAQEAPRTIQTWHQTIISPKQNLVQDFPSSVEQADEAILCQEYVNFATKSEDFLNSLIEKSVLLSAAEYKPVFAQSTRIDEQLADTLSYNIQGVAQSCSKSIGEPAYKLGEAYKKAVNTFA